MRLLLCTCLLFYGISCHAQDLPHHHLKIVIDPGNHSLKCVDEVSVPAGSPRTLNFLLNRELLPISADSELRAYGTLEAENLTRYAVTLPEGKRSFTVSYGGEVFEPPKQDMREARVFEQSSGIIAEQGAVLSGASGWYPIIENVPGDGMITFALDVAVPRDWDVVSQGRMTRRLPAEDGTRTTSWEEQRPQDEIHLIAAPFRVYGKVEGDVTELVYLRSPDNELAQQYLDATTRYLGMYRRLIGDYPYAKFALAENFWETGYGMPSFTLLGSQVIRLPFIIYTSYPHEILHNWWGNGVYVDYQTGNWSEGLTAYLADHLLQEQKGTAAEYRRSTLQKYTDYASAGRDFPLKEFVSRHSASSEAVGYGKSLMMFHMLRRRIGDDKFKLSLQRFYAKFKFRRAGYRDLEKTFSEIAGEDLAPFFQQLTERPGAPEMRLLKAETRPNGQGYELNVAIEQIAGGSPFSVDVPLAVTLDGEEYAQMVNVGMNKSRGAWTFQLNKKPLRVDLDPEFDVFRRLDSSEVPPAFSQVFGATSLTIILPRDAPPDLKDQYQATAAKWQEQVGPGARVVWDDEIRELSKTGAVWLFGWENRWRGAVNDALRGIDVELSESTVRLAGVAYSKSENALALVTASGNTPVGWLAVPGADMMPVLARKLPHYSKYSYAVFAGEQLQSQAKGMWPQTNSALQMAVDDGTGKPRETTRGKMPPRPGLISD
jgi:hypothetical protein